MPAMIIKSIRQFLFLGHCLGLHDNDINYSNDGEPFHELSFRVYQTTGRIKEE